MTELPAGLTAGGGPAQPAPGDAAAALTRFLALAVHDDALATELAAEDDGDSFARHAAATANRRGIAIDAETVRGRLLPDPLGLSRWSLTPHIGSAWPGPNWLPIQVGADGGRPVVDWAYFGAARLTQPFFEDSIRRALHRPFNRICRYRMTLDDMVAGADAAESLAPSGFIFHMSRCGSTLVAQMLAALADTTVISEAAPLDGAVRIAQAGAALSDERRAALLRAMLAAFGRRRRGDERHLIVKLDSWHALALPLLRRAFPHVPWVFLYRDPVEVLVSQMSQRGLQMVPQLMPPALYGIDDGEALPAAEYCARVLGKVCAAAADGFALGGGLAIDYRDLPGAVIDTIMPHFGITAGDEARAAMRQTARFDAKAHQAEFSGDSDEKQRAASAQLRTLAERHVGEACRRLAASRDR